MIVYKYTNTINGKIYIGITTRSLEQRHREHMNSINDGTYFHNALKKHGENAFTLEVIDTAESKTGLSEKEQLWIKHYNSFAYGKTPNGYNETIGGEGMTGHAGELNSQYGISPQKRMSSDKFEQWKRSLQKSARRGDKSRFYGKHPQEWIGKESWDQLMQRLSDAWTGDDNPQRKNPKRGKDNPNYGRVHTEEQRIAQSASYKNKKLNAEIANEIRVLYAGGNHTQQSISEVYGVSRSTVGDIINKRIYNLTGIEIDYAAARTGNELNRTRCKQMKPVIKLDEFGTLSDTYSSITEAATQNKISTETVSRHILGKVKKPQYAYAQ